MLHLYLSGILSGGILSVIHPATLRLSSGYPPVTFRNLPVLLPLPSGKGLFPICPSIAARRRGLRV